jgi:GNAT superfamily N-acetyltransferase
VSALAAVSADGWRVRPAEIGDATVDADWVRGTLAAELATNSYLYGVDRAQLLGRAALAVERCAIGRSRGLATWECLVVSPADEPDERAGWVIFESVPTLTVAYAYVEPAYRRLGAWRALREAIGLRDGMHVAIVLGSPRACSDARKRYVVKHNWGRIL